MKIMKRFVIVVVMMLLIVFGAVCGLKKTYPKMYLESVERYANEYKVDPLLVLAIIKTESNFNARAISKKGAKGLMQIMESTAQWSSKRMHMEEYNKDMLLDPDCNIRIGVWYFRWLYDKYNDIDLAIVAYNGGMGNVDRWLSDKRYSDDGKTLTRIPFEETSNYLLKVKFAHKVYKFLYTYF